MIVLVLASATHKRCVQIGRQYAPKTPEGTWRKFYHNRLYELTDEAIRGTLLFRGQRFCLRVVVVSQL